jgi:hypothetical protein
MPAKRKNTPQQWDIQDGKVVVTTPAKEAETEEMDVERLDREIARSIRRRDMVANKLSDIQADYDDLVKYVTDLEALKAQLGG